MGQYSKPALELLCDQIHRDNPDLDIVLDADTLLLLSGPLTTNLGSSGRNTRIRVNGVMGMGSSGKRELFYDRINLNTLTGRLPAGAVITFGNDAFKLKDALPTINDVFGLLLEPSDLSEGDDVLPLGSTPTDITVQVSSNCLNFTGALVFKWRRGAAGFYPDSGPGTKQMQFGDLTEGYFGTVFVGDMLTAGQFYIQMTEELENKGTMLPLNDPSLYYFKFAIDGKYIFVPSKNLVGSVSWEEIYKMGGIDASGVDAKFPPASGSGVTQTALLDVKADEMVYWLRPRLARFSETDPAASAKGDPTSETERLFNKVHKGPLGLGMWDIQATGENGLDLTSSFFYLNSVLDNTESVHYAPFNLATLGTALKTAPGNWRPVLELIDPKDVLVPMKEQVYEIVGPAKPIVFDAVDNTDHLVATGDFSVSLEGYPKVIHWESESSGQLQAMTNLYANGNTEFVQPIYWDATITPNV